MDPDPSALRGEAPYLNATGAAEGLPSRQVGAPGRESREREAASRRRDGEPGEPHAGLGNEAVTHRAFAALADHVRDFAIFLMDPAGIITFWGESARRVKGWTKQEAEGGHLRMLYPDGGSEDGTAEAHLAQAVAEGEYIGEGLRIRADGSTFWAGISLTALRDASGELIGFAKVARDLTGRRAAEAALKAAADDAEQARRRAEEANRAKNLFLATMSHEIRTPINAVMGYVDLLSLEIAGALGEQQHEYLGRIRSSNMHLLGIIDEILDLSRLDAGRVRVARRAGLLDGPVRAAVQMIQMQAEAKRIAVSDSVSGFVVDVPYWGDEDRVRQILVVILSNAVKFTPPGGRVTLTAGMAEEPPPDVHLAGEGPWLYLRVEDTGPGIDPDRLAAIFEPFEQADMALTRVHGGTGLGLTIARRLARLMSGDLTVRSRPGMGSSFFLWLPVAAEEAVGSPRSRGTRMDPPAPLLLAEVRDAILVEIERIAHAYVARLRSDPATPRAQSLTEVELEDHTVTLLADLAETLRSIDLAAVADDETIHDGTAIQRTVAERHGLQRRRLGWSEEEIRREFEILREEVAAAIRRRVPAAPSTPAHEEVVEAIHALMRTAERISVEASRQPGL